MIIKLLLAMLAVAPAQTRATGPKNPQRANIFALASGAVLVSNTPSYGGGWEPLLVMDDNATTGWSSPQNRPNGSTFVIELAQRFRLSSIAFDNAASQESGHPGISARTVEVWVSTAWKPRRVRARSSL